MTSATCRSSGRRSGFVDIPQIKRKRTTAGGPAVVRKRPKGTQAVRLPPGFLGSVEGPGGSLQPDGVTDVEEPTAQTHDATIAVVNVSRADAYVESNLAEDDQESRVKHERRRRPPALRCCG